MAWGDSWGSSPSRNARELAEAFYAGKARKRGEYEVVLVGFKIEYRAFGSAIAFRTLKEHIPEIVRLALVEGKQHDIWPLRFSWGGFSFAKDVARHLRGLGVAGVECARHQTRYQDQRFAELAFEQRGELSIVCPF